MFVKVRASVNPGHHCPCMFLSFPRGSTKIQSVLINRNPSSAPHRSVTGKHLLPVGVDVSSIGRPGRTGWEDLYNFTACSGGGPDQPPAGASKQGQNHTIKTILRQNWDLNPSLALPQAPIFSPCYWSQHSLSSILDSEILE